MSRQFQMYLSEEDETEAEMATWIDQHKDIVGGESAILKLAMMHLKKEKGAELESINPESEDETLI